MAVAKKRATLASDLLAAKPAGLVDEPGARQTRRGSPKRPVLLDVKGEAEPKQSQAPDPEAQAVVLRSALAKGGGLFSRKGTASAATFKPWYWTYDGDKAAAPPAGPVVALLAPPAASPPQIAPLFEAFADPQQPIFPFEVPPAPPEPPAGVVEILPPAASVPVVEDAQAREARRHRTAFAEQLSAIIEGILASREFAALVGLRSSYTRGEREALAGPAGLLPAPNAEITHASLRAELAQARPEPEPEEPARPWIDRVFLIGGALMVIVTGFFVVAI